MNPRYYKIEYISGYGSGAEPEFFQLHEMLEWLVDDVELNEVTALTMGESCIFIGATDKIKITRTKEAY